MSRPQPVCCKTSGVPSGPVSHRSPQAGWERMLRPTPSAVVEAADEAEARRAADAAVGYRLRLIGAAPVP